MTPALRQEAAAWAVEAVVLAMDQDLPLADRVLNRLRITWSTRMTNAMGYAHYRTKGKRIWISLSAVLWPHASEEERRETVFHEIAHILEYVGRREAKVWSGPGHHGPRWRWIMRVLGYPNAARCHSVENPNGHPARCGCGPTTLSPRQVAFLRKNPGRFYTCRECKEKLVLQSKIG